MSVDWGLVRRASSAGPLWKIFCEACRETVAIIKLPPGELDTYLRSLITCPSGKHALKTPGEGLSAGLYLKGGEE